MAQRIADAAIAYQMKWVSRAPESVTVELSADMLVITMHGESSPAGEAVARSSDGDARVQEFHRRLFASSSESMCQEIENITGAKVGESIAGTAPAAVVQVFATGTMIQVFQLSRRVASDTWALPMPMPPQGRGRIHSNEARPAGVDCRGRGVDGCVLKVRTRRTKPLWD